MEVKNMKKLLIAILMMTLLVLSGCNREVQELPGDAGMLMLVKVETQGIGLVCIANEGETLEFDEDVTSNSAYMNGPEGTVLTIGAKESMDDYHFLRWEKDGAYFSDEREITVTVDAPVDFIAVFGVFNGWDGPTASTIEEVKTIGDVLGLPYYGYSYSEDVLVYVFELDGIIYRAIADVPKDVSDALNQAFGDDQKFNELIAPLEIKLIENVSEMIPTEAQLEKYIGKTGGDLLDEGWQNTYYYLDGMEFGMEHGWFTYIVNFEGKIEEKENIDIEKGMRDLKIVSIRYEGLSNRVTDLME